MRNRSPKQPRYRFTLTGPAHGDIELKQLLLRVPFPDRPEPDVPESRLLEYCRVNPLLRQQHAIEGRVPHYVMPLASLSDHRNQGINVFLDVMEILGDVFGKDRSVPVPVPPYSVQGRVK